MNCPSAVSSAGRQFCAHCRKAWPSLGAESSSVELARSAMRMACGEHHPTGNLHAPPARVVTACIIASKRQQVFRYRNWTDVAASGPVEPKTSAIWAKRHCSVPRRTQPQIEVLSFSLQEAKFGMYKPDNGTNIAMHDRCTCV